MTTWTPEQRNEIVKRLQERGVNRPCPRCGSDQFNLVDGYAVFGLVDKLEDEGVRHLAPSVCVACARCGYLTFHAMGALGLLPKDQPLPPGDQETADE
jgi:ribosomal protein S27AE